jgi:serine/threonine protein kinase
MVQQGDDETPIPFDAVKIRARIEQSGLPIQELARLMGVHRGTVFTMLKNGMASPTLVRRLFDALEANEEGRRSRSIIRESDEQVHRITSPKDWSVFSVESPVFVAANGVNYQVAKLRNTLNPNRYARGKLYDLRHLTPTTLRNQEEHLLRHSKICANLHGEPRLPIHFDIRRLGEDSAWWVLDEWIEGKPLSTLMVEMPTVDPTIAKVIGSEILLALGTLHSHRIVVRELAPERVIVTHDMTRCVVTDFEMAKLLDGNISVRGKWKLQTPYRAPEISKNFPKPRSDLFSWGVIMSELLTGDFHADEKSLSKVVKDNLIVKLLLDCRKVVADDRPKSSSDVLKIWNDWKI